MKKHASSHGLAVLVCTVIAGVLVRVAHDYFPSAVRLLDELSNFIVKSLNLNYRPQDISVLLLAVALAVIWGIGFYFAHSDKRGD